jgi:DNA-binding PadR family transcriptional regulator
MAKESYEPEKCELCTQTTTYILSIDRGTTVFLKAIARAIQIKGINIININKEMMVDARDWSYEKAVREGKITANIRSNIRRLKAHGLVAKYLEDGKHNRGNYVLTRKGAQFLKGKRIPKHAICDKVTKSQVGYWLPSEEPEAGYVSIDQVAKQTDFWEGINYDIQEGSVIIDTNPQQSTMI